MSESLQIFDQALVLDTLKVHATAVNEGFLVTLIASTTDDDVIWAATTERSSATLDDVASMITDLGARFNLWKTDVAAPNRRGPAMTHHIALTIARDNFEGKFTCTATPGERCRLTCTAGCESWYYEDHEHDLVDAGSCGMIEYIESDSASLWELYEGEPGELRSGPVELTYRDEYVSWAYPSELEQTIIDLGITLVGAHGPMGCGQTLFVLTGNHIMCDNPTCPDYTAVNDILADPETEHIVTLDHDDFAIKHPLRERIGDELLGCQLHISIAALDGPPAPPGTYRVTNTDTAGTTPTWTYMALAAGAAL